LREVAYDYEDSFRQISSSTGGYITFSNNVTKALQEVTEAEDFHYMLVYQPKISTITEEKKIEVKVNRSGINLIYLKDAPKIEAPPITINDFKAGKKTISFRLNNYIMTKIKDESTGIVDIKIILFDENSNKVFDRYLFWEYKTLEN
jgi:ASC-1-like (ASCH) protein